MAIDVFGLRAEGKVNKFTKAQSIRDLYANPKAVLAEIPEPERWNVFFSLASDNTQDFLPININNVHEMDVIRVIDLACRRFCVDPGQVLSLRSGFGVQILIPLKKPITEKDYTNGYFADRQKAYQSILQRVANDLADEELSGQPQLDVFQRDWAMRMPETMNIRGSEKAKAKIINNTAEPVEIDLFALDTDTAFDAFSLATYESVQPKEVVKEKPKKEAPKKLGTEMFRDVFVDMQGKKQLSKIRYYDLVKHLEKEMPYKTVKGEKVTYYFDKTHYKLITHEEVSEYVIEHTFDSSRNDRGEVVSIISSTNLVDKNWFASSTFKKINFQNGVLDLKTKELLPHSLDYGFFYCLPYEYNPDATCPNFDQHLKDITCDDEDLQNILLEYMGYAISNDEPWAQKALILTGEGNNGKSTFVNTLYNLVGPDSYSDIKIEQLGNQQMLANIEGKLFNISDETPEKLYKSSHFKNIVSGGNEIVKRLYVQPYSIKVRAKLIVLCNDLPASKDTTHGFFRRFLIVPFDRIFTSKDEDPFIAKKLESELSGILNKVLSRYETLIKNKRFSESKRVKESVKNYMEANDPIRDWLSGCDWEWSSEDTFVTFTKLYESYKNFCLYNHFDIASTRSFSIKLRQVDKKFDTNSTTQRYGQQAAKGFKGLKIILPMEVDHRNY
jgi:P4 family phage/plasmid primase-like protien